MAAGHTSIDPRIEEELRQITEDEYPDGAAMGTAIDAFLARQQTRDGITHYSGSGWNTFRALSVRTLEFPPAKTRGHIRRRMMSLSRLSRWLGCGQDTQDLAFFLLSMSLSKPVNPDWARALLEAVPTCGRKAIQDLVLMEHLGRPKAGQEAHWQWTLQRLTQDCLSTEDGTIVHSFNTTKHAKTLLALAYLWRAGYKQWVGDEISRS